MPKPIVSIRGMSEQDLVEQLEAAYRELLSLRCNYALARSLQNPARIAQLKKTVARILTVQREKNWAVGLDAAQWKHFRKSKKTKKK